MGVEYRAALIVGRLGKDMDQEVIDEYDFDCVSPYYDADVADCIYGYAVATSADYQPKECNEEFAVDRIENFKKAFKELTGLDAKLWISPYGH